MNLLDKAKELNSLVKLKFYRMHELTTIFKHTFSPDILRELKDLLKEQVDFLLALEDIVESLGPLKDNVHDEMKIINEKWREKSGK